VLGSAGSGGLDLAVRFGTARSTITGNTTALGTSADGSLLFRGNNTVEGNGTDGAFTGSFTAK
jgi:hypothetical protein